MKKLTDSEEKEMLLFHVKKAFKKWKDGPIKPSKSDYKMLDEILTPITKQIK